MSVVTSLRVIHPTETAIVLRWWSYFLVFSVLFSMGLANTYVGLSSDPMTVNVLHHPHTFMILIVYNYSELEVLI